MKNISRIELIKELVRKKYGKKRPTGGEIMMVIREYDFSCIKATVEKEVGVH
tara:strand:+ start:521 stop:676 length:156 start_codon:yes stop_codon:yes gene_type:complete